MSTNNRLAARIASSKVFSISARTNMAAKALCSIAGTRRPYMNLERREVAVNPSFDGLAAGPPRMEKQEETQTSVFFEICISLNQTYRNTIRATFVQSPRARVPLALRMSVLSRFILLDTLDTICSF